MACCTRSGGEPRRAIAWGDALHLDGDIVASMADPACFDRAAACATLLLRRPPVIRRVSRGRARNPAATPVTGLRGGVTGSRLIVARWLATDPLAAPCLCRSRLPFPPGRDGIAGAAAAAVACLRLRQAMNLTPREKDKLLVAVAAMVAARRLERGVRLNYPEAVALITDYVLEGARDGRSVAELMRDGATVLSARSHEGVAEMIHDIQVEATFPTHQARHRA